MRTGIIGPVLVVSLLGACGGSGTSSATDGAAVDASLELVASNYCESIVDSFCEFYLRCGRMSVPDVASCREPFLESCNATFEPRYVDLEAEGLLRLSDSGLSECEQHLSSVSCDEQFFELSGPCAALWEGTQQVDEDCGLDVEFFVCEPNTECVIGLDFCGQCESLAPIGGDCSPANVSCGAAAFCDEGVCRARVSNGQACTEQDRCFSGSSCDEGVCRGPSFVSLGEACDRDRRCPYLSACVGDVCVATARLGGACSALAPCEAGYCESGTCQPPKANGQSCSERSECQSGLCDGVTCAARPGPCIGG